MQIIIFIWLDLCFLFSLAFAITNPLSNHLEYHSTHSPLQNLLSKIYLQIILSILIHYNCKKMPYIHWNQIVWIIISPGPLRLTLPIVHCGPLQFNACYWFLVHYLRPLWDTQHSPARIRHGWWHTLGGVWSDIIFCCALDIKEMSLSAICKFFLVETSDKTRKRFVLLFLELCSSLCLS